MARPRQKAPAQHWTVRLLPLLPLRTLKKTQELAQRFREVEGIRLYVRDRMGRVVLATLVLAFISIACAVGVVAFLADRHSLLTLLGILLLPISLVASFLVLAYVFFSWIEGRALARQLGHRHRPRPGEFALWLSKKYGLDMGPAPPVPWLLATIALFGPLALLATAWWSAALVAIALGIAMPFVYAKFDP